MRMNSFKKDGIFRSTGFKCEHCRKKFRPGTSFVVYSGPGTPDGSFGGGSCSWWGCVPCAGIYADIVSQPAKA